MWTQLPEAWVCSGAAPCSSRANTLLWPSAAVVLHGARVADRGLLRVLPELAPRPALPEQVPALVQLDLEAGKVGVLGLMGDLAGAQPLAKGVLLVDEALDAGLDVLVAHAAHDRPGAQPWSGSVQIGQRRTR